MTGRQDEFHESAGESIVKREAAAECIREQFKLDAEVLRDLHTRAMRNPERAVFKDPARGCGHLYYDVVRALKPGHILVVGQGKVFNVAFLATALKDNGSGRLNFLESGRSSLRDVPFGTAGVDSLREITEKAGKNFQEFGLESLVTCRKITGSRFLPDFATLGLPPVDLAFIDGGHSYREIEHVFMNIVEHGHKDTHIFLHDGSSSARSLFLRSGVKRWLNTLRKFEYIFRVLDVPFDSGVALVTILRDKSWKCA